MTAAALAPTVELVHGAQMPRLGLGTSPLDDADAEAAVASAIDLGYRLIDTAHAYGNETGVGRALAGSDVAREELFITSKLNAEWHGFQEAQDAFAMSAEKLGVDYIDLFLIHWPNPRQDRYVDAFRGLIELLRTGRVRAIGLSNFKPEHVQRVIDETGAVPDVNQIELDPTIAREESRAYHRRHDIVTESWSPLGNGGELLQLPAIAEIAERHGRTTAQIVLRWHVQIGAVPIPKSANPSRQAENLAVFDFELDQAEMDAIAELDRGESAATDSNSFGH
jgi:2,5-diketo-D-gluconate reductase A